MTGIPPATIVSALNLYPNAFRACPSYVQLPTAIVGRGDQEITNLQGMDERIAKLEGEKGGGNTRWVAGKEDKASTRGVAAQSEEKSRQEIAGRYDMKWEKGGGRKGKIQRTKR